MSKLKSHKIPKPIYPSKLTNCSKTLHSTVASPPSSLPKIQKEPSTAKCSQVQSNEVYTRFEPKILRPEQKNRNFTEDIFKHPFFNQSNSILRKISPNFVSRITLCSPGNVLVSIKQGTNSSQTAKVHGANRGPTRFLSAPDGPHIGPMNLAIRDYLRQRPLVSRSHIYARLQWVKGHSRRIYMLSTTIRWSIPTAYRWLSFPNPYINAQIQYDSTFHLAVCEL